MRNEVDVAAYRRVAFGSIACHYKQGVYYPLSHPSHINDRFFLGGPLDIRGFSTFGLGPKDKGDVLGGDLYYRSTFSYFLPFFHPLVKSQFFINAGQLMTLPHPNFTPSISVGAGVAIGFSNARVECNYVFPLLCCKTDSFTSGVQFGIGGEFS